MTDWLAGGDDFDLKSFFAAKVLPLEKLAVLGIEANQNILPLNGGVHQAWVIMNSDSVPSNTPLIRKRSSFLRWLCSNSCSLPECSHQRKGSDDDLNLSDWNHNISKSPPQIIQHDDLYLLSTSGPVHRPLPNSAAQHRGDQVR